MALLDDLRVSLRLLARDRGYTVLAALVLALGIGVCNTAFTMLTGMFLHRIPIEHVDRLVYVETSSRLGRSGVSLAEADEWLRPAASFSEVAVYRLAPMNVAEPGRYPEQSNGMWMTPQTLRLVGQRPLLGRDLGSGNEAIREPVALLAHRYWRSRYGADRTVIGRVVRLNGVPTTIVGVMPEGMDFDHRRDVWTSIGAASERGRADAADFTVLARLKEGVSLEHARAEMTAAGAVLAARRGYPRDELTVTVTPFADRVLGSEQRAAYSVLAVAVVFVLLISCANVANLLLARAGERAPAIAVRMALGAGRWTIVRQLLVESLLLGLAAGALGLALSFAGVSWLRALLESAPDRPFWVSIGFDAPVFLFLAGVSTAAGLLTGIAPAWLVSGVRLTLALHERGQGLTGSRRTRRITRAMVIVQLAVTVVLLVSAGLLIRTFVAMYRVDPGIDTRSVLTAKLRLSGADYPDLASRRAFFDRLEAQLSGLPGLRGVSVAGALPLEHRAFQDAVLEGADSRAETARRVVVVQAGVRYFDALGARVRRGRTFRVDEGEAGREVAIISEQLARTLAGVDPIGRRLGFLERRGRGNAPARWFTIVGVVTDIRQNPAFWPSAVPAVYLPYRQEAATEAVLIAGGSGEPAAHAPLLREVVRRVDPNQPLYEVMTLDARTAAATGPFRALGTAFGFLGLVGLVMAAAAMYGAIAWAVERRRRETGIRLALGADAGAIWWLFGREALSDAGLALALGLPGALAVGFVLRAIIKTSPIDPATLGGVTLILLAATLAAVWLPLRRVTRVDPMTVLRAE